MPDRRATRHNLRLPILDHLLRLVTRVLPETPDRRRPVHIPRIRNTGQKSRDAWKARAPDIPVLVEREVVEWHVVVYGTDFFESYVGLELHDADLGAHGVGDVVEAVSAPDEAVGEVEAFGGGDVTALVLQGTMDETAAAGEEFEIMLLIDEDVSVRRP